MAQAAQTYKTHRRYNPVIHFFVEPVLVLNIIAQAIRFNKYRTPSTGWTVMVAIALAVFVFAARYMTSRVQDRVIRLEERIRLGSLLPEDLRSRVNDLTPSQLIGLRFAPDEEAAALASRCLAGELTKAEQIKKEVKTWRPDYMRA